jgi:metal-dependent amidase/aminoacylase/carboxypeptidase family protein
LTTALRARIGAGHPRIAILAEYDALPEIGHACSHNLIAAGALGAFLSLARAFGQAGTSSKPTGIPGTIELIGTPAEEGGGGKAACVFQVRASTLEELGRVRAIVERCARGAALALGVDVSVEERVGYKSMRNNTTRARRFGANLEALGRPAAERDPSVGAGSTDMGDISQAIPAIHPYLAICDRGHALCHQHAFAICANAPRGHDTACLAAKALARTTLDLLTEPGLLEAVRAEFEAAQSVSAG